MSHCFSAIFPKVSRLQPKITTVLVMVAGRSARASSPACITLKMMIMAIMMMMAMMIMRLITIVTFGEWRGLYYPASMHHDCKSGTLCFPALNSVGTSSPLLSIYLKLTQLYELLENQASDRKGEDLVENGEV